MGSASWIQEGTPALPPWHPHSTVFYQLTLYPLVNLVPFTGNTSTSQLLWRASSYPHFTLQFPTRVLDTHKVLVHRKSKHKSPRAALWWVLVGVELFTALPSLPISFKLFTYSIWDFSLSHQKISYSGIISFVYVGK